MKIEIDPLPPVRPIEEPDDELGKMFRIFVLATLLGGAAAFAAHEICGPEEPGEASIRVNGSTISVRSIGAGMFGGIVGLPIGVILVGLFLGEPGRGALIGAFACFLGAAIGSGCSDPIPGIVIGGLGAGIWCAVRLSG